MPFRAADLAAAQASVTSGDHVHALRNQSVGRTCSVAASGPRFSTVMRMSMSSGEALAYSTKTSK